MSYVLNEPVHLEVNGAEPIVVDLPKGPVDVDEPAVLDVFEKVLVPAGVAKPKKES